MTTSRTNVTPEGSSDVPAQTVEAQGLRCPLPLLRAKQALNQIQSGQCLRVLATDKGSVKDFHAFARLSGHTIEAFVENDGVYEYVIRKLDV